MQLRLQLESFEGPLELLLALIEQRRLPITSVSLAQVADQYLAQVHALPELDPDLLADFLAIAGRLLLLKSRALLLSEGEPDPEVEETATELAERLATYRVFRAAAEHLQRLEALGARGYPTNREPQASAALAPLLPVAPPALRAVMLRLQAGEPPATVEPPGVARASVDERRALILDALSAQPRLSFGAIAGDSVDCVIASFLAVLELFRRGLVELQQPSLFGELTLVRPDPS
jgi:segregation and condensation protein A